MIKKQIEDKELNEFLQTLEEDKLRIFTIL